MKDHKTYPVYQWLIKHYACEAGMAWIDQVKPKTHKQLWNLLLDHPRFDWLCWYFSKIYTEEAHALWSGIFSGGYDVSCLCDMCSKLRNPQLAAEQRAWLKEHIEISED